jgi:hypothetical protein
LINKEFYENIFKNYFIPILQLINKDNIVTEQNDLKKIAEYLNFITDDDVDTNDEKRKKINRDFQIFEKYVTDDNIDEIELKRDVENSLGKLKNLMATTNFDKDKIIDIKDLKEKIDIINNKIDKWKAPSWQDILLSTFDSDIETINKKGLHKYNKIYIDAIGNFLSIEGGELNNYDEKSISKIKNEIEKALTKIKELKEDESNEKDTSELLNIVLINIKKLLLNLINKNYTKNISSIQKLKQYCKNETAEINKYIDNYKIKLDEFSMQKTSSIPEEPKKENIEKPPVPKNEEEKTFDSSIFTDEDVERIRTTKGAFEFWKKQGITVDIKDIKAELSPDGTYVTTYWDSPLNEISKNEKLAEFKDNNFYLNKQILQGEELINYAKNIKDKKVFKAKTIFESGIQITTIEDVSTPSGLQPPKVSEVSGKPEEKSGPLPGPPPTGPSSVAPPTGPATAPGAPEVPATAPGAPGAPGAPEPSVAPATATSTTTAAETSAVVPPEAPGVPRVPRVPRVQEISMPSRLPPPPPTLPGTQRENGFGEFGGTKILQSGTQQRGIEQTSIQPQSELPKVEDTGFWKAADRNIMKYIIDKCTDNNKIDVRDKIFLFPPKYDKLGDSENKYVLHNFEKNYSNNPWNISKQTFIHNFKRLFSNMKGIEKLSYIWYIFIETYLGNPYSESKVKENYYNMAYKQVKENYENKLKSFDMIDTNIKKEAYIVIKNIKDGKDTQDKDKYYYDKTFNIDKGTFDVTETKFRDPAYAMALMMFTQIPFGIDYKEKVRGEKYDHVNKYGYPLIVAYKKNSDLLDEILKGQQRGIEQSPTPNSLSINQSTIGADNTAAQEIKKERKGIFSRVKDSLRNAIDQQVDDGIQYLNEESEKDEEQNRKATRYYLTQVATRTPRTPRTQQQYIKPPNNPPPAAAADPRGPMTDSRWVGGNNIKNTIKVSISKESKYKVCGYVTDVEGNMDYFNKYVKISKILEWTNDKKNRLRFKKGDSIFVYGGDTQDKGQADIRFVNILLKFKEDYPNRVIFIIGNRDANKLRIPSELFETYKNEKIFLKKYDNYPYWIDIDKRITLKTYLKENNYKLNIKNRLKYIIESNMGFEDGFEKRRTELSIILKKNISKITDTDVISSFVNSVMPFPENIELSNDNYTLKYLMQGQIAYIFGEHIFVHGAINEYNIGQIPKNKNKIDDINIWVNELNSWFHKELNEYINNPTIGGITKKRKAYNIIDYVIPKEKSISVVHANNLKKGNGKHINKNVSKILNKYGIKNIITGHKPHGDCPLVIRDKNITAISADTSYSNVNYLREKNKIDGDNRGNAVSEVLLYSNGYIRIHGKYANNSKYSYILKERTNEKNMELNDYIGMQLNNKYWIKNIKKDKFLISYGKDYELYEKWISLKEVKDLLK